MNNKEELYAVVNIGTNKVIRVFDDLFSAEQFGASYDERQFKYLRVIPILSISSDLDIDDLDDSPVSYRVIGKDFNKGFSYNYDEAIEFISIHNEMDLDRIYNLYVNIDLELNSTEKDIIGGIIDDLTKDKNYEDIVKNIISYVFRKRNIPEINTANLHIEIDNDKVIIDKGPNSDFLENHKSDNL